VTIREAARTRSTRGGWRAYTSVLFILFVVGIIYNGVTKDFLPNLDRAGWRTHTVISNVYLGTMVPGEYRLCTQAVEMPTGVGGQIDLTCGSNDSSHTLSVKYHGRIDRATATVMPHWKCRREDWTLECWAVD
jgi:hypothetical protein